MDNPFKLIGRLFIASMVAIVAFAWWGDYRKKVETARLAEEARLEAVRQDKLAEEARLAAEKAAREAPPPRPNDLELYAAEIKSVADAGNSGRFAEGLPNAEKLVELIERDEQVSRSMAGNAYSLRCWMHEGLKHWPEVLADGERATRLWQGLEEKMWAGRIEVQYRLALAYDELGRKGEALLTAERILDFILVHPEHCPWMEHELRRRQCRLLREAGRKEDSLAAARVWRERLPLAGADRPLDRVAQGLAVGSAFANVRAWEEALAQYRRVKAEAEAIGESLRWRRVEAVIYEAEMLFHMGDLAPARKAVAWVQSEVLAEPDVSYEIDWLDVLRRALQRADQDSAALELELLCRKLRRDHGLETPKNLRESYCVEADCLYAVGRFQESHALRMKAAEISRKESGSDSADHVRDMTEVAVGLYRDGRESEAVLLLRECVAKAERLQPSEPYLLESALDNLGFVLTNSGRDHEGAEPVLRRAIELNERRMGPGDASSLVMRTNLFSSLIARKRWDDAERYQEELWSLYERNCATEAGNVAWLYLNVALLHEARGRAEEAYRASAKAVAVRESKLGTANERTRFVLRQFVPLAWAAGHREESVRRGEELLAAERDDHGWTSPRELILCARLAVYHAELGHADRARELCRALEAGREACFGERQER